MVAYTFHLHGALRWPHGTREEQSRFSVRPGRNVAGANFSTFSPAGVLRHGLMQHSPS